MNSNESKMLIVSCLLKKIIHTIKDFQLKNNVQNKFSINNSFKAMAVQYVRSIFYRMEIDQSDI